MAAACGSLLRGRKLVIPYATSDYATTFATVSLDHVLAAIEWLPSPTNRTARPT